MFIHCSNGAGGLACIGLCSTIFQRFHYMLALSHLQVAMLTERIVYLTKHMQQNQKVMDHYPVYILYTAPNVCNDRLID